MNIFVLDKNPVAAARYHCDKHVVKMILESAQMLATAHYVLDGTSVKDLKPTHADHPCSVWVRESSGNYWWLLEMTRALCNQYALRYGRQHKYEPSIMAGRLSTRPLNITAGGILTPHPQCMPEVYRVPGDAVLAYRFYYIGMKMRFARWRNSVGTPYWLETTSALFDAEGLPYAEENTEPVA